MGLNMRRVLVSAAAALCGLVLLDEQGILSPTPGTVLAQGGGIAYWLFETVRPTSGCGSVFGLDFDAADRPVVGWSDCQTGGRHFWGPKDSGAWAITEFEPNKRLPGGGDTDSQHAMAVGPDGTPWMLFSGAQGEEIYNWRADLSTDPTGINSVNMGWLAGYRHCYDGGYSIAFAPGSPLPSWLRLKNECSVLGGYLTLDGTPFLQQFATIQGTDHTLMPDGRPRVLFASGGTVRLTDGTGAGTTIASGLNRFTGDVQIAAAASGTLHAIIRGYNNSGGDGDLGEMGYLTSTDAGATWSPVEMVDTTHGAYGIWLTLDRNDAPAIAFWRWNELWYATRAAGSWYFSRVATVPWDFRGASARLAFDRSNTPNIAFHEASTANIRFVRPAPPGSDTPVDMTVSVIPRQNPAAVGVDSYLTVRVDNRGIRHASDVVVRVTLPTNLTHLSAQTAPYQVVGQDVTFRLATILAGTGVTLELRARTDSPAETEITAEVTAAEPEQNPADNITRAPFEARGAACFAPRDGMYSWFPNDDATYDATQGYTGSVWWLNPQNGANYVPGVIGKALHFDGVDDYARLDRIWWMQGDWTHYPGTGSLTLHAWIRTTKATGVQTIIVKQECSGLNFEGWWCQPSGYWFQVLDGKASGFLRSDSWNAWTRVTGTHFVADGQFHDVALVRDMAALELRLYVDGVLDASVSLVGGAEGSIRNQDDGGWVDSLTVGANWITVACYSSGCAAGPVDLFAGDIDDVAIYMRALTPEEIAATYTNVLSPACGANSRPTLANPGDQTNTEGAFVSLQLSASDADGDPLSYDVTGLPPGLEFNPHLGVIFGTLAAGSAGTYPVTVSVDDGHGGTASTSFKWTVSVDVTPDLINPGPQTRSEGDLVKLFLQYTNPDPSKGITFWTNVSPDPFHNLPPGLNLSPYTGLISGVLSYDAAGVYTVTIHVANSEGGEDQETFTWTVLNRNRPPVITKPADGASREGDPVSVQLSASDPDGEPLTLTLSALTNGINKGLPAGMTFDTAARRIDWTPTYTAAGVYNLTVTASDPSGALASASFIWTITNVNQPPTFVLPADRMDPENTTVAIELSPSDLDGDAVTLTVTAIPNMPPSVVLVANKTLAGKLSYDAAEDYVVTVTATDGLGGSTSASFRWTVTNVNRPPVLMNLGPQISTEGDHVTLSLTATDPEGDPLTFSAKDLPPGLSIDPLTGLIGGVIPLGVVTTYDATVTVSDGEVEVVQVVHWQVLERQLVLTVVGSTQTFVQEQDIGERTVSFTLELSYASSTPVFVDFATRDGYDPPALAGEDYVRASGTLVFNPGETTKSLEVAVKSDTLAEPVKAETFWVDLVSRGAVISPGHERLKISIMDDDDRIGSLAPNRVGPDEPVQVSCIAPGCSASVWITSAYGLGEESPASPAAAPSRPGVYDVYAGRYIGAITVTEPPHYVSVVPKVSLLMTLKDLLDFGFPIEATLSQPLDGPADLSYAFFVGNSSGERRDLETGTVHFEGGATSTTLWSSWLAIRSDPWFADPGLFIGIRLFDGREPAGAPLHFKGDGTWHYGPWRYPTWPYGPGRPWPGMPDYGSYSRSWEMTFGFGSSGPLFAGQTAYDSVVVSDATFAAGEEIAGLVRLISDHRLRPVFVAVFPEGGVSRAFGLENALEVLPLSEFTDTPGGTPFSLRAPEVPGRYELSLLQKYVDFSGRERLNVLAMPRPFTVVDEPTLGIEGGSIPEGDGDRRELTFKVALKPPAAEEVTVDYATLDGSAKAGSDYSATSGTLRFAPGETHKAIRVPILGDRIAEGDEVFTVRLATRALAARAGSMEAAGEVGDDDASVVPYISSVTPNRVEIGGEVSVYARGGDPYLPILWAVAVFPEVAELLCPLTDKVEFITSGTATDRTFSGVFHLKAPERPGVYQIRVVRNESEPYRAAPEPWECRFTNPPYRDSFGLGTFTVVEPLNVSSPTARWRKRVKEGNAGTIELPVTLHLSEAQSESVGVDYRIASLKNGDRTGTVTFAPGQTTAYVPFSVLSNRTPGDDDRITVSLANPRGTSSRPLYIADSCYYGENALDFCVFRAVYTQDETLVSVLEIEDDDWATPPPPTEPPLIESPGDRTSVVGDTVHFRVNAASPRGAAVTFSAAPLPQGVLIDPLTGDISGVVGHGGSEFRQVNVTATVGDASATASFVWRVIDTLPGQQVTTLVGGLETRRVRGTIAVTYDTVESPGFTSAVSTAYPSSLPDGFRFGDPPVAFDLTTSASFTAARVCLRFTNVQTNNDPRDWRILHLEDGEWVDRTSFVDRGSGLICADVTSFSPFALAIGSNLPAIAIAGPDQFVEAMTSAGATVNLDARGSFDPEGDPLTYTWTGPFDPLAEPSVSISLPVGSHLVKLEVEDSHGGRSADTVVVIVRDTTPPAIVGLPTRLTAEADNPAGANVAWADPGATDAVSGSLSVACNPASGSRFPLGSTSVVCRATDEQGNSSSVSFDVLVVDTTPPIVTCGSSDGLWHSDNLLIPCSAVDAASGLDSAVSAGFTLETAVSTGAETAAAATGIRTVCDVVGNCAVAGPVVGHRVDRKPPAITITSPTATSYMRHALVKASYACADAGSGVATCSGPTPNGGAIDTSTGGLHAYLVTATDSVGNTATASVVYTVEEPGRMHGEGHVDDGRVEHHFEFRVSDSRSGEERGHLRYWVEERSRRQGESHHRFDAEGVISVAFSDDPAFRPGRKNRPQVDTVIFSGMGRWDGVGGHTFEARALDAGEPGRGRDQMSLTIRNRAGVVVATFGGPLAGGNIQSLRLGPPSRER